MLIVGIHLFCVCTASLFFIKFSDPSILLARITWNLHFYLYFAASAAEEEKDDSFICINASCFMLIKEDGRMKRTQ